jgi:glycosyltransferase involved in cell wall biosynthesis
MKILLVANYPLDRQISMRRFVEVLERGLTQRGHAVEVIAPRAVLFPAVKRHDGIWKWVGYVNKFLLFRGPLRRAASAADIVHVCDHSNAMYVASLKHRPHLITCHDVIAIRAARGLEPGWRVGVTGRLFQRLILRGLRRANRIACVSEFTQAQLLELAPGARPRLSLIHNGLNFPFAPLDSAVLATALAAMGLGDVPYFLHVGSALPRKNRAHVVRVFAALRARRQDLPHRLVFVGAALSVDIARVVEELGLKAHVVQLNTVDNERLRALYSGATALIFPSLSEGFGWPVIESQACGCPVFISNLRPLTDIGGDAAIEINPVDPIAAASVIAARLERLPKLREACLRNAARFSAAAMIDGYERLYAQLAGVYSPSSRHDSSPPADE